MSVVRMMMRSPEGRILFLRLAGSNEWTFPGVEVAKGESMERELVRAVLAQTRFNPGHAGKWFCRTLAGGVDLTVYIYETDEFVPKLSPMFDAWQWMDDRDALREAA
jgi:hypothetical protein